MPSKSTTVNDYLKELPSERVESFNKLRNVILKNIPKGFEECISYGMIGYVVPHKLYPHGYHCDPKLPLPFVSIGSQKNFIVLHHLGIYGSTPLLDWFVNEYPKHSKAKLDMGKGCIRFKKMDDIPYELIAELMKKLPMKDYINFYEEAFKSRSKK